MLLKRKGYLVEVTTKIISLNLCKAFNARTSVHLFPETLKHDQYQDFKFPTFQVLKNQLQQNVS